MLIYPTLKMTPIRGLTGFGGGATGSLVSGGLSLLFPFSSFEFTQAGDGKRDGRTRSEFLAHSDYDTSTYSWLSDTNFFDVTTADGVYPVGIQIFTVPATATYRIEARGGHGGSIVNPSAYTGGIGARIQGDFDLTEGEKLEILVGNEGGDVYEYGGGFGGAPGGGGSFVIKQRTNGVYSSSDILIIAGGGGGAEYHSSRNTSDHGGNGQPSTVTGGAGQDSSQVNVGSLGYYGYDAPTGNPTAATRATGGINGYGGGGAMGGGGGGFYDRGGYGNNGAGTAGNGYIDGTDYGASDRARGGINDAGDNPVVPNGGFGGGAGAQHNTGYGGGAGGYSGGGGGNYGMNGSSQGGGNGGGGGSFNSGSNKVETTFTQATHPNTVTGYESFVKITLL